MTDKELKKLSRLELLEILLEESKENERLRTELQKKSDEYAISQSIKNLSSIADKMTSSLETIDAIAPYLQKIAITNESVKAEGSQSVCENPQQKEAAQQNQSPTKNEIPNPDLDGKTVVISDRELYIRIMRFFSKNEFVLAVLPTELQNDIKYRLRGILNGKN